MRPQETLIEAYEYFLRGRQFFHLWSMSEVRKMFEKAIEMDSNYAPAYASLSGVHCYFYEWQGAKNTDLVAAQSCSEKALSRSPNLAESHTSRAFTLILAKEYEEAGKEFMQAIQLNPNSFDTYYL